MWVATTAVVPELSGGIRRDGQGYGDGAVVGDDGLIDCSSDPSGLDTGDCVEWYRRGVFVTLNAQPDEDSFVLG